MNDLNHYLNNDDFGGGSNTIDNEQLQQESLKNEMNNIREVISFIMYRLNKATEFLRSVTSSEETIRISKALLLQSITC
jgi:hypothetical protein